MTVSGGIHRGETKFIMKKGLIYRQFTLRGKTTSQLVVPSSLTDRVMTLAHESLMAGHLGIRKTIDRVVAEFFLARCLRRRDTFLQILRHMSKDRSKRQGSKGAFRSATINQYSF